ncbi:MAG: hypothetical protein H0X34_09085 [Chthoniobacterales bacterium]|nr:hypothetical protein [Chthoniobacterales bacterium]
MSLKQLSKDSRGEPGNIIQDTPDCWHRDRERTCLRVEMRANEVFIFPYSQFLCAHHVRAASHETLRITLSNHEITLTGRRLERLLPALQEFAVDWIRPLPTRYRDLDCGSDALITAIDVKSLDD